MYSNRSPTLSLTRPICLYDAAEQRTVYINRQLAAVLGYSPEELLASGTDVFRTLLHPDDVAQAAAKRARLVTAQAEDLIEVRYRLRHADGEWRWLKSREWVFRRTATGAPTQLLGIAQDSRPTPACASCSTSSPRSGRRWLTTCGAFAKASASHRPNLAGPLAAIASD
ncbi:MAG: PAS domain-containing protein, partial [Thermodesulfobacteriota bacterium]